MSATGAPAISRTDTAVRLISADAPPGDPAALHGQRLAPPRGRARPEAGVYGERCTERTRSSPGLTCDRLVTYTVGMDAVFRALADPTRRGLLDELYKQDGQSLKALEGGLDMTRFGVMKHLRVLEEAGLVSTQKRGREKLHFLNPVPIRLIHDRWVSKYAEPWAATLTGLKKTLEEEDDGKVA
jgi:DNA-binding transcriptional ArsR family regulator